MDFDLPYDRWERAVKDRISRRKYYDDPIRDNEMEVLQRTVKDLKGSFPLAEVMIMREGFSKVSNKLIGSYGLITGASSYGIIAGRSSEDRYRANIQAGALGESLVLEATSLGLDTCWMGGFFEREDVYSEADIGDLEVLAIVPLGEAKDSLTIVERLAKRATGSHKRKPISELCSEDFLDNAPDWMRTAVDLARRGPSAMNRQPWRFDIDGKDLVLTSALKKKNYEVSPYLDCGIALLHLLVGAGYEGIDVDIEYGEPPLIATLQP